MDLDVPDPPEGMRNLNSQRDMVSDGLLRNFEEILESESPEEALDDLTTGQSTNTGPQDEEAFRERALEYVADSITLRERLRPDSLRSASELPDKIIRVTSGGWVNYFSEYDIEHDRPIDKAREDKSGKFLLFAPDRARELENVILEEFKKRPYNSAKINSKPTKDDDWVVCLYQQDDRYYHDVRDAHANPPTVRFRGFKTNTKTRRGEYSEEYKNSG